MSLLKNIDPSWQPLLRHFNQDAFLHFRNEILPNIISYPEKHNIFRVFSMPLSKIKVVILGQSPSPIPGQAQGLAFGIDQRCVKPLSLQIIAKEIEYSGEKSEFFDSDIKEWRTLEHLEQQGVFLFNTALTVESGVPESHVQYWEQFAKEVIFFIATHQPCIWLMWGLKVQRFTANLPVKSIFNVQGYDESTIKQIPLNEDYNYVLKAESPTSLGFFGCNHFKFVNEILSLKGQSKINW